MAVFSLRLFNLRYVYIQFGALRLVCMDMDYDAFFEHRNLESYGQTLCQWTLDFTSVSLHLRLCVCVCAYVRVRMCMGLDAHV